MKNILSYISSLFKTSKKSIVKQYLQSGKSFGEAASYLPAVGKCCDFDKLFKKWKDLEVQYVGLGYRSISIDDFESFACWGGDISNLSMKKREENEPIIYHAEIYEMFFGNYYGESIVQQVFSTGKVMSGTYLKLSTKNPILQKKYLEIKNWQNEFCKE